MGIRLFKITESTNDGYKASSIIEPRPDNFIIVDVVEINNNLVATVKYPNCTSFEGKKVLVFKGMTVNDLRKIKLLDPHFSLKGLSPFARFVPTEEGLEAAKTLCSMLH